MNKLLFRAVFFCLSVLSLSSCRQNDETDRSNESVDLVAVNIPIEGVRVESVDSPLTRAGSADTLTVTEDLEDGFVLETSLMPVSEGLTRAAITTGLASDVQILAIAYRENGTLYKCQYFTPGSPIIHLPKGERFKLVFYSYNSTAKPDISRDITGSVSPVTNGAIFSKNASLNDKTEIHTNNVMWGRIDRTPVITGGITLSGVTFTHLFSRLDWRLQSVVGTITECSGSVRNTYENGTIKLGNLVNVSGGSNGNDTWIGAGNADYATSVKFATSNSTDITSSKTVFCPNFGQEIVLALDRIVVGGKTFTGQRHTFPTKLKRGVDYTAVSTIKRRMTVTFRAAAGGKVNPGGEITVDKYGDIINCTATADAPYKFDGWYRGAEKVEKGNGITVSGTMLQVTVNEYNEGGVFEARFEQKALEWAPANLMYKDGQYIFKNVEKGEGFNKNAFFLPQKRKPDDGVDQGMRPPFDTEAEWTWDPCRLVSANGGQWRMPTRDELSKLKTTMIDGQFVSKMGEEIVEWGWPGMMCPVSYMPIGGTELMRLIEWSEDGMRAYTKGTKRHQGTMKILIATAGATKNIITYASTLDLGALPPYAPEEKNGIYEINIEIIDKVYDTYSEIPYWKPDWGSNTALVEPKRFFSCPKTVRCVRGK